MLTPKETAFIEHELTSNEIILKYSEGDYYNLMQFCGAIMIQEEEFQENNDINYNLTRYKKAEAIFIKLNEARAW